jgi:hypothetical protein
MTLSITKLSIMTLNIMRLSIMTLSMMTLRIMMLGVIDTIVTHRINEIPYNNTQHKSGYTKGGSITVPLTSYMTGLE